MISSKQTSSSQNVRPNMLLATKAMTAMNFVPRSGNNEPSQPFLLGGVIVDVVAPRPFIDNATSSSVFSEKSNTFDGSP